MTEPILTPLKTTGAPKLSPPTDPSKKQTALNVFLKNFPEPRTTTAMTNKEIAQRLYLQHQTVKNYVHLILQKLNLRNRLELIRSLRSGKR